METVKDILNFCIFAVFYEYRNVRITCELNQVRKCLINSFYQTIPDSRIRVNLSKIDDIILKINNNDIENILDKIDDLKEKYIIHASI